jgi:hypothetical protein
MSAEVKAPEATLGEESEKRTEIGKEKKPSVEGKVLVERGGEYVLVDEDDVAAQEMRQLVRDADAEEQQQAEVETETKKEEKRRASDDDRTADGAESDLLGSSAQRARSARARSADIRSPRKS